MPGEICGKGPHALIMYFKDPVKTEEAMKGGWFHSGDIGVMDEDRYITVADRKKDMIKTGGENVPTREVEEAIYPDPRVQGEVAVIGLPRPEVGREGDGRHRAEGGADDHRGGDLRPLPQGAGGPQVPEEGHLRGRPAQDAHGQDPQAGAATEVQQVDKRRMAQGKGQKKASALSPFALSP